VKNVIKRNTDTNSQEGVSFLEATLALPVFFLATFIIIEIARYFFFSIATSYIAFDALDYAVKQPLNQAYLQDSNFSTESNSFAQSGVSSSEQCATFNNIMHDISNKASTLANNIVGDKNLVKYELFNPMDYYGEEARPCSGLDVISTPVGIIPPFTRAFINIPENQEKRGNPKFFDDPSVYLFNPQAKPQKLCSNATPCPSSGYSFSQMMQEQLMMVTLSANMNLSVPGVNKNFKVNSPHLTRFKHPFLLKNPPTPVATGTPTPIVVPPTPTTEPTVPQPTPTTEPTLTPTTEPTTEPTVEPTVVLTATPTVTPMPTNTPFSCEWKTNVNCSRAQCSGGGTSGTCQNRGYLCPAGYNTRCELDPDPIDIVCSGTQCSNAQTEICVNDNYICGNVTPTPTPTVAVTSTPCPTPRTVSCFSPETCQPGQDGGPPYCGGGLHTYSCTGINARCDTFAGEGESCPGASNADGNGRCRGASLCITDTCGATPTPTPIVTPTIVATPTFGSCVPTGGSCGTRRQAGNICIDYEEVCMPDPGPGPGGPSGPEFPEMPQQLAPVEPGDLPPICYFQCIEEQACSAESNLDLSACCDGSHHFRSAPGAAGTCAELDEQCICGEPTPVPTIPAPVYTMCPLHTSDEDNCRYECQPYSQNSDTEYDRDIPGHFSPPLPRGGGPCPARCPAHPGSFGNSGGHYGPPTTCIR